LAQVAKKRAVSRFAASSASARTTPSKPAPFFFAKPADALVVNGADPAYPSATENLHHEVELVVAVGENGEIAGWAVGVDLTRRDLQAEAKAKGRPWEAGKAFDQSAPCGALTLGALPDADAVITLKVNGETRQSGRLSDMIWDPAGILAKANELWTLQPGDLIFTGTPEGVGPLVPGDRVEARIEGLAPLNFTVKS
jgi:fumarylpyruvate hydrolase